MGDQEHSGKEDNTVAGSAGTWRPLNRVPSTVPAELDRASSEIIAAAIEVHRRLGPGFLESIYRKALMHEMRLRGLSVQEEVAITVLYKDLRIDGQRLDIRVEPGVIVELKTVDALLPIHEAQLMSYLRTTGCRLGLLINFRAELLKKGLKRVVL